MTIESSIPQWESQTKRPASPGGEKWLGEVVPILDHGFIYLVDYMGNDQAIEQAARVSYGSGTRNVRETRGLIRYLLRHQHTTPFEMVEFKFHAKMPIFVARQWIRHRTANVNEYSGRYSILDKEFYVPTPEVLAAQSTTNRQGRGEVLDAQQAESIRQLLIADAFRNYDHYESMLNDDGSGKPANPDKPMLARELARMDLTLNYYTQWYWKIDLHNLLHFLKLRMDEHAQYEIRIYADIMAKTVEDTVPPAWEAFRDYELGSTTLSNSESRVLLRLFEENGINFDRKRVMEIAETQGLSPGREIQEFLDKLSNWAEIINNTSK
ncbi:FAD-dependent thymidylate synthase [Candidatus Microgenomates bacterium]|nr:FAD-dependent thymidylate synthase [Candidatus Microgenomates bacterium]